MKIDLGNSALNASRWFASLQHTCLCKHTSLHSFLEVLAPFFFCLHVLLFAGIIHDAR